VSDQSFQKIWQAWTGDDLARLRDLRASGLSIAGCAKAMGRTKDSVTARLRNPCETQLHPWTPAERATLWAMRGEGQNLRDVAEVLGRTYHSCRNQARNGRNQSSANRDRSNEARDLGIGRHEDARYAALCMAQGGFWAYSERRGHRGYVAVCLPLLPPQASA
jgi:hypothetical protein